MSFWSDILRAIMTPARRSQPPPPGTLAAPETNESLRATRVSPSRHAQQRPIFAPQPAHLRQSGGQPLGFQVHPLDVGPVEHLAHAVRSEEPSPHPGPVPEPEHDRRRRRLRPLCRRLWRLLANLGGLSLSSAFIFSSAIVCGNMWFDGVRVVGEGVARAGSGEHGGGGGGDDDCVGRLQRLRTKVSKKWGRRYVCVCYGAWSRRK